MVELEDGTRHTQSGAILKMFAAQHGYWPTDPQDVFESEHLDGMWGDIMKKYVLPANSRSHDQAVNDQRKQLLREEGANIFFSAISRHLREGNRFVCGDNLTWIDFVLGGIFTNMVLNPNSEAYDVWCEVYPNAPANVRAYVEAFQQEMQSYLSTRPSYCTL